MDLSKDAVKLLSWMKRRDGWKYIGEIENQSKCYDYRSFRALVASGMVESTVFEDEMPEYDETGQVYYPPQYSISDFGKAYLESRSTRWIPELREWIAIGISVVALLVSILALIL